MHATLTVAIAFLYGLCALTMLALLVLFGLKLRHIQADKMTKRCLEKYRDYFLYLQAHGEEEERFQLPPGNVTVKEKQIIQKQLFELMERFTGFYRQKLNWLCEDMGLIKLDMERLNSFWKWTKIDAAYNLGMMRAEQAVPGLLQLLEQSKYESSMFIVARSLAKCARDLNDLRQMVVLLVRHRKHFHQLIVDMISDSPLDPEELFISFLTDEDPDLVKVGLIGLSVHAQLDEVPGLYELVRSADKDVRIKAVKLMCQDVRYLTPERVDHFLTHRDWEIRAAMAKAIGELGLADFIPRLKQAVGDENWWVRHYSAHSLAQLQVEGFAALCEILRDERSGTKTELAHQVVQQELERSKQQRSDVATQLEYNEKLYLYQQLTRKTRSTEYAMSR